MRQPLTTYLLCTLLALSLIACGTKDTEGNDSLEYTDALGRIVEIESFPERLVSLAPSVTETIFAAGASDLLVAVSAVDNYPAEVDSLPKITVYPVVDYEQLLAIHPDVVFASTDVQGPDIADRLSSLGIAIFYLDGSSLDGIFNNVRLVGKIAGRQEKADTQADLLSASVRQMTSLANAAARPPRVLVLVGDRELYSFGQGSYINEMVRAAGGLSISEDVAMQAPVLSDEFVLTEQPEIIILAQGEDYDANKLLQHHPSWSVLPAARDGRIYSLDADLLLRPGPRVVDGILKMATVISPEVFQHPETSSSD